MGTVSGLRNSHLILRILGILKLGCLIAGPSAQAYQLISHEQMAHSALIHLKNYQPYFQETAKWVRDATPDQFRALRAVLLRSSIEADLRPDLWGENILLGPANGGHSGSASVLFTSVFHFIVIRENPDGTVIPGEFWKHHDGYSWRHSSQTGAFDSLLSLPTSRIRGDLSHSLGGTTPAHVRLPFADIPAYKKNFRLSDSAFRRMFHSSSNRAIDAVFPPADVPAELAFNHVMRSPRATRTTYEQWWSPIAVMSYGGKKTTPRRFTEMEVEGYPSKLGALGLTLHLAQDLAMPHHTIGTLDFCHHELEEEMEKRVCGSQKTPDQSPFFKGTYEVPTKNCQHLYDPDLVARMLKTYDFFRLDQPYGLSARLRALARTTHQWRFGTVNPDAPNASIDQALDFVATQLPNGQVYSGNRCRDLFKHRAVQEQIRTQFNLGVAASIMVIELAARNYENGTGKQRALRSTNH